MTAMFERLMAGVRRILSRAREVFIRPAGTSAHSAQPSTSLNLHLIKRRSLSLLGRPGIAGIGLLSICPAFYFSAILPLQEKLASASNSVIALQEQKKHAGREPGTGQRTPEEQLNEFYRMFPADSNMPEYLEKIFSMAQAQGIRLDQGEYRVVRNTGGSLVSFQMTLPVKGRYPLIRKYLAALMAEIPVLSLQQIQFKRQKVGNSLVEANIRLELYLLEQRS